jgi:hypothetical protein
VQRTAMPIGTIFIKSVSDSISFSFRFRVSGFRSSN